MKKFFYLIAALSLGITNLLFSCPFKVINNSMLHLVLIKNHSFPEKEYFINAGEEAEIPDANQGDYLWVYAQEKIGSTNFKLKYGILKNECHKENILPELKYSTFKGLSLSCPISGNLVYFFIRNHDSIEESSSVIPSEITHKIPTPTPCEAGIVELVKYIDEGKITLNYLENKVSPFIFQAIKQYINDLKY